jgi:nucleoside-diphosphate-sugar epimerase
LRGEELKVFGHGGDLRTYAFVEDIARVNLAALGMQRKFTVNVPGFRAHTQFLADQIVSIAGSASTISHVPARTGDVHYSRIGSDEFHMLGGCGPRTSFHDGLVKTFEWWKDKQ